ncbi:hypothetical protein [Variovorax paradoxus]|uniref:Uncharacterized protein n=1 Tax=Variovorax paradoxus TaxID=34073 RepID=A0A6I6HL71_VARPD|nr:hypothetical protein [Variovorax paradoxus]QGW83681.1 hypothetical protein GOQ09_19745 [Variovorax paradoxus]
MRQFQSRQQHQRPVQDTVRPSAHVPAREAATKQDLDNEMLDRAAALWTTRRIRSFFLLLEHPSRTTQR